MFDTFYFLSLLQFKGAGSSFLVAQPEEHFIVVLTILGLSVAGSVDENALLLQGI